MAAVLAIYQKNTERFSGINERKSIKPVTKINTAVGRIK